MKLTIDITDSEKDIVFNFLKENGLSYELESEISVPDWQQKEVLARRNDYDKNPDSFLSVSDLKAKYYKK